MDIPTAEVDGNDVVAVSQAAAQLVDEIRAGGGPRLLHARTYRLTGHTAADAAPYRPQSELDEWLLREPIRRLAARLTNAGATTEELSAVADDVRAEVDEAYANAKSASYPPVSVAFEDVQDIGDPRQEAF
jgi:pyruvate dehydrogenase E1 component alpha subunit